MVQLQLLTGMRPGEVIMMRGCDLNTTGEVWEYVPQSHKTEHRGRGRTILIGPRGQEILRPFLKTDLQAYLFSPREAVAERKLKRAGRRTAPAPVAAFNGRQNPVSNRGVLRVTAMTATPTVTPFCEPVNARLGCRRNYVSSITSSVKFPTTSALPYVPNDVC